LRARSPRDVGPDPPRASVLALVVVTSDGYRSDSGPVGSIENLIWEKNIVGLNLTFKFKSVGEI
jgi:hypothetical protein